MVQNSVQINVKEVSETSGYTYEFLDIDAPIISLLMLLFCSIVVVKSWVRETKNFNAQGNTGIIKVFG